jgi:hypothetical protein
MYSTRNEGRSVGNTASFSVCDMSGLRDLQNFSKHAIAHHIRGHDPFSRLVIQTLLEQSGREVGDKVSINDRSIAYSWAGPSRAWYFQDQICISIGDGRRGYIAETGEGRAICSFKEDVAHISHSG